MNSLTKPLALLQFIEEYLDEYGYPPSRLEMVNDHGISSTSVATHYLGVLEKYGYIKMEPRLSRAIRILRGHDESVDAPQP